VNRTPKAWRFWFPPLRSGAGYLSVSFLGRGMMKFVVFLILLAVPFVANGTVYKCEKNGSTNYSDKPCGDNAERLDIETSKSKRDSGASKLWEFIDHADDLTGDRICVAKSPNFYLGRSGNDWLFASLRVGGTRSQPLVILNSERSFDERPTSFHNDIDGLGIRVGESPFVSVNKKINSYILAFSPSDGERIVADLMSFGTFQARLRFWPYDQSYDSPVEKTLGLKDALEKVYECGS
jgi:hypothetical protein